MSAVGSGMKAREASHMSTSIPVTSPASIISIIWSTVPLLPAIGRASMKNFLPHTHTHTHTIIIIIIICKARISNITDIRTRTKLGAL